MSPARPVGNMTKVPSGQRERNKSISGSGGRVCFGPSSVEAAGVLATVQATLARGDSADNKSEGRDSDLWTLGTDGCVKRHGCGEARVSHVQFVLVAKNALQSTTCARCVFHPTHLRSPHIVACITTNTERRETPPSAQRPGPYKGNSCDHTHTQEYVSIGPGKVTRGDPVRVIQCNALEDSCMKWSSQRCARRATAESIMLQSPQTARRRPAVHACGPRASREEDGFVIVRIEKRSMNTACTSVQHVLKVKQEWKCNWPGAHTITYTFVFHTEDVTCINNS